MMVIVMMLVLLLSAGLAIRYGLGIAASREHLWDRLGGSFLAAIGVAALYFGIALVRAMF